VFIRPTRLIVAVGVWALVIACVPQPLKESCVGDTITGTQSITTVVDQSATGNSPDLSSSIVSALLPRESGGFTTCKGTGVYDGTFSIPNVPPGVYYLQLNKLYVVTSQRNLDLSYDLLGRIDAVPAQKTTEVSVSFSNGSPWQQGRDLLEIYSAGSGTGLLNPQDAAGAPFGANETSLAFTADWSRLSGAYTSKSDSTYTGQLVFHDNDPTSRLPITQLAKWALSSPTITDGVGGTISGSFSDVSLNKSLTVNWERGQFDQAAAMANPSAKPVADELSLSAEPQAATRGDYASSADLLFIDLAPGGSETIDTHGVQYGNPYPGSWNTIAKAGAYFSRPYKAGDSVVSDLNGAVFSEDLVSEIVNASTIQPYVLPVSAPTIGGQDALQTGLSGVGPTPDIAYTLPTPPPDQVVIIVRHLLPGSGTTTTEVSAVLRAAGAEGVSSIRVPPGVMESGEHYFFVIRTVVAPKINLASVPLKLGLPYGIAEVLTGDVTP
jgi:hypothetical protein